MRSSIRLTIAQGIEARQVAPAMLRVNAILDDVKGVTAKVKEETERVDHAIHSTIDRIDDTADRVRTTCAQKPSRSSPSCAARAWRWKACSASA